MTDWAAEFPDLFTARANSYADADLEFRLGTPPDELIARIHLIALDGRGRVVVCRSVEGWRFLPGGTREPKETLRGLIERELLEEAGATLLHEPDPVFAYTLARSRKPTPYRPHLPHPAAAWAYAVARVRLGQAPANPPHGETVVEVLALAPDEAAAWLSEWEEEPDHGRVLRLAIAMGLLSPDPLAADG